MRGDEKSIIKNNHETRVLIKNLMQNTENKKEVKKS